MRRWRRWIRRTGERLLYQRTIAVFCGVLLVLVPTLFTVFSRWSRWSLAARLPIVVAWLLAATVVVVNSARQSRQVDDLVGRAVRRRRAQRDAAGRILIEQLLGAAPGFPEHYDFRLFLYDRELNQLLPTYEPDAVTQSTGWKPGHGATGVAFQRGEYVIARGEAAHDGTYGLTDEQQQRYADLAIVAAMPIRTARQEVIGVLSGSSQTDDGFLAGPDGQEKHAVLAATVGRVLIDVLRIADD